MAIFFPFISNFFTNFVLPVEHALWLALLFVLMPCLTVLMWWKLNKKLSASSVHPVQRIMRVKAGQDELLIRVLEEGRLESRKPCGEHERHGKFGVDK